MIQFVSFLEMQKAEKLKINNESEYDISENIYSFPNDTFYIMFKVNIKINTKIFLIHICQIQKMI